jgi:thymidine phosphorylase
MAVVELRGGRQRKEDTVDPAVGVRWLARVGQRYRRGEPVAEVLARPGSSSAAAAARLTRSIVWTDEPVPAPPRFLGRIPESATR